MGDIRVIPVQWETQIGPCSLRGTNGFTPVSLPFAFPFYGTARTTAFVGTSGYITFNAGDTRSDPVLALFTPPQLPRIAVLMGGFSGGAQGCTHINTSIAGRVVVTYSRVVNTMEWMTGGSNTFQMILFSDGRIQFGYRGVTALGNLMNLTTGLFPGPTIPSRSVNYSDQPSVDVPGGTAVFEVFTFRNLFDLDGGFIVFTPTAGGGYNIRTIMGVSGASRVLVSGGAAASAGALAQSVEAPEDLLLSLQREGRLVIGGSDVPAEVIANAEVEVRSSTDAGYRGMTNTDRRGNFTMSGVPPGGIQVEVRKNGQVVARGTAIVPPLPTGQSAVTVVLVDPAASPKK